MEQTKGYLRLKGKVWSLNNKEARDNGVTRSLSFGLQTSRENSIFIQIGEFKNSPLNIKIKGEGETEVREVNEQDAIEIIKETFKDGDSVYINARAVVDTYRKSIKYLVNQIYIEKEPINFDSEDFEETNELSQTVIITEKPENKAVKVGVTTYKGEMVELDLKLSDTDVNDYFEENVKVGDLMKLTISVNRKPNYIDQGEETERKTLKGKSVKSGGKKIDKSNPYTEYLEVIDVDLEKIEKKKYDRSAIRESLDSVANKQHSDNKDKKIQEDDLPF